MAGGALYSASNSVGALEHPIANKELRLQLPLTRDLARNSVRINDCNQIPEITCTYDVAVKAMANCSYSHNITKVLAED